MQSKIWLVGAVACALWACSDDGGGGGSGQACPEGTAPGAQLACLCSDAGEQGITVCQDDNTLTQCDCSGTGTGTMGGTSGGGSGGTSGGTGGAGGTSGGTGGTGGTMMDDDAGVEPNVDGGVDAGSNDVVLPMDGNQSSVCTTNMDCNDGFGCYNGGTTGQGYCSVECMDSTDCESLTDASYVCSASTGVCSVQCTGEDDDASCPPMMECLEVLSFPQPIFRCKYPEATGSAGQFEACATEADCEAGLICAPSGQGADLDGYCTAECTEGGDECDGISGGSIDATCAVATLPFDTSRCILNCEDAADGCPSGMECIEYMIGPTSYSRCGIAD